MPRPYKDTTDELARKLTSDKSLSPEDKVAMINHYLKTKQVKKQQPTTDDTTTSN